MSSASDLLYFLKVKTFSIAELMFKDFAVGNDRNIENQQNIYCEKSDFCVTLRSQGDTSEFVSVVFVSVCPIVRHALCLWL